MQLLDMLSMAISILVEKIGRSLIYRSLLFSPFCYLERETTKYIHLSIQLLFSMRTNIDKLNVDDT